MDKDKLPLSELLFLVAGELIVALLTAGGFLLFGYFDYTVATGALLGVVCVAANFLALSLAVNRAVDNALAEKEGELDDEAAAAFAKEHAAKLALSIRASFIIRTLTMLAVLVLAFLSRHFNPIATLIPLVCMRPILTVKEMFGKKEKHGQS